MSVRKVSFFDSKGDFIDWSVKGDSYEFNQKIE